MRMVPVGGRLGPPVRVVIRRSVRVMPSSRINTVALGYAGSISNRWQGMPMGGSVSGGQLEILATTVSIPSGRLSGIGTTRIVVDDEPAGMLTSQGNCG